MGPLVPRRPRRLEPGDAGPGTAGHRPRPFRNRDPAGPPLDTSPGPDNSRPALHYMSALGDLGAGEPSTHKDFIAVDYHGKAVSHLDALSHVA